MLSGDSENFIPVQRLEGKNVSVQAFDMDCHLQPLWDVQTNYKLTSGKEDDLIFTYLKHGPFSSIEDFKNGFQQQIQKHGRFQYVVEYNEESSAHPLIVGTIGYLEVVPEHRKCEIGNLWLDPMYRRRNIMDEAIYLLLKHAFEDAKYRRVQWTCNSRNEGSKKMALRNQFKMEGVQRNYFIIKGVSRDDVLFSIIDSEWEDVKMNFQSRIV